MFYLIWQMGLFLILAFGIGLAAGWMIWSGDARSAEADASRAEAERLRGENEALARRLGESEAKAARPAVAASAEPVVEAPVAAPQPAELVKEKTAAKTGATGEPSVRKSAPASKKAKPEGGSKKSGAAAMPAAAKGDADDLTTIKGLGPKAAAALGEGGVTRFAQIAGWSEADIAAWDEKINGRGRIVRDDWVGQAKTLAGGS